MESFRNPLEIPSSKFFSNDTRILIKCVCISFEFFMISLKFLRIGSLNLSRMFSKPLDQTFYILEISLAFSIFLWNPCSVPLWYFKNHFRHPPELLLSSFECLLKSFLTPWKPRVSYKVLDLCLISSSKFHIFLIFFGIMFWNISVWESFENSSKTLQNFAEPPWYFLNYDISRISVSFVLCYKTL